MALEFAADTTVKEAYPLPLAPLGAGDDGLGADFVLDWGPLLEAVLSDLRRSVPTGIMAARFHNALVEAIVTTARQVGEPRVALSGGCFQNRLLVEGAASRLNGAGFEVLLHRQVPPNDGCISLGQVMVAAAHLDRQNAE